MSLMGMSCDVRLKVLDWAKAVATVIAARKAMTAKKAARLKAQFEGFAQ